LKLVKKYREFPIKTQILNPANQIKTELLQGSPYEKINQETNKSERKNPI
jgi:hypothetical protein